jgi:hypothetical protein
MTAFNTIFQSVSADNPFACVAYMPAGVNYPPVENNEVLRRNKAG